MEMLKSDNLDYIKYALYSIREYSRGKHEIDSVLINNYSLFDIFINLLQNSGDDSIEVKYFIFIIFYTN
jgi:hypothetical protein